MNIKSERLKKLESELHDLDQWLRLGLVPKKDLDKHKIEIEALKERIEEEKERLRFLKENNTLEQYAPPKKAPHARQGFPEGNSLPDIDVSEEGVTDAGLEMENESFEAESSHGGEEANEGSLFSSSGEEESGFSDDDDEDEEDPFSDRNRWKRGVMEDPDADNW